MTNEKKAKVFHYSVLGALAAALSIEIKLEDWVFVVISSLLGIIYIYKILPSVLSEARTDDVLAQKRATINQVCSELSVITATQVVMLGAPLPEMKQSPSLIFAHKDSKTFFFFYQTGINLFVSAVFSGGPLPEADALSMFFEAASIAYHNRMIDGTKFYGVSTVNEDGKSRDKEGCPDS